jgi:hypothetical protein
MNPKISIGSVFMRSLRAALARPEDVVFSYATFDGDVFDIVDLEVMTGADVESRSDLHVTLADEIRPRLIKTAHEMGRCLIEAHSHGPRGFARFSPSDLLGFEEWVTHVRWRLGGRPYAALVMAGEAWDAVAWIDGPEPVTVECIEITEGGTVVETITPTNATAAQLTA